MVVALGEPLVQLGEPGGQGTVYEVQTADGPIAVKVYLRKPRHNRSGVAVMDGTVNAEKSLQDELAMLTAVQGHPNVLKCLGDESFMALSARS